MLFTKQISINFTSTYVITIILEEPTNRVVLPRGGGPNRKLWGIVTFWVVRGKEGAHDRTWGEGGAEEEGGQNGSLMFMKFVNTIRFQFYAAPSK